MKQKSCKNLKTENIQLLINECELMNKLNHHFFPRAFCESDHYLYFFKNIFKYHYYKQRNR